MKVGDLVKYKDIVKGMTGLVGIVISYNGYAPRILWLKRGETETEIPDFLEVINESR